ncbi:MAG: triose-phosphate isomerase [Candidatus Saccharibacteria bacterium]|nr:triose-phosphate isomerase [Candidatus Saccharibacteria bacterium]
MKTYIVGNWKMNLTVGESSIYLHKLLKRLKQARGLEVVVAPSLVAIQSLSLQVDRHKIKLAAQNFYHQDYGAYTGEVSISQLRTLVDYAIVGHSERRYIFKETDKDIRAKVAAAIRNGVTPILCIGETASERDFGETKDVLRDQLFGGLSDVSAEDLKKVIIAYEPVWAISSVKGARLASPDDIATSVDLIHKQLKARFGKEVEEQIPVLYGGSVNPSNAGAYLTIPGVNGLLIGGSSLIADHFVDIIDLAKRLRS